MARYQSLKKRIQKIEQQPESQTAMIKRVQQLKVYDGSSFADICSPESMRVIWGDDPK